MSNHTTETIDSASLQFREGGSDKVYHAAIEPAGPDAFVVTFAYGRRGNTLTIGTKTPKAVPFEQARRIFEKLVKSKLAKGYRHAGGPARPRHRSGDEGRDTGIRPQLLNPVEENRVGRLIASPRFCLQQKHDGRRLLVLKQGDEITGVNRRGLAVAIPEPVREAVAAIPCDVLIDGEAVGDVLHAFDLLEFEGAGNATIPPNHRVPAVGEVVEVRYLHAHRQSGAVYQPVYLGLRDDIPAGDCTVDQLKYKPEPALR